MLPLTHLIIQLLFAYPLYNIGFLENTFQITIFMLLTIIIDTDHFLYHMIKGDIKNTKRMLEAAFGKDHTFKEELYLLHAPELNILLLIAGFYYHLLLVVFVANAIHITCDLVWDYYKTDNWELLRKRSIIGIMINKR